MRNSLLKLVSISMLNLNVGFFNTYTFFIGNINEL